MVERQGRGVGEERPARGGGGWTRRIWRVDFWPGRSSRRWISRRCSAPPRDSLSGRWSCRCWMPGPGSNGSRAGPGRRRTRSREVCSSGRCSRRTRRWPGGRSRTLARPRRRASPMHGERPQSATQNGHAYSTYRIVQIQMARGKPPIPKGRSRIYLQRVAERLKAKRRNFDPLCDYADENHRDVFHARGDLPPLIPSPRLARFRPVYDPLERGEREDGRGRKEGKVGWYFGRNGRRTPSARASPAIGMKRERRFPEWSIAVENLSPRFLGNEQPAGARRRFYRGGRVQSFIEPEGPLRLVENWNRHAPNFSKFQGGGGKMHPPPSSSIRIRGRSRKRYLRVSNFSLFNRVWANV